MAKVTDHSGDQQVAPLRYGAIAPHKALDKLYSNGSVSLVLCDLLAHLLATVERLEAAEKAKAVERQKPDDCEHLPINGKCLACGAAVPSDGIAIPPASPPVPPSPPAARLQVGDYAFERTNRTSSGWRIMESTRLADLEGPVGPVLAAALEELARLRARLGKAETWYVMAGGGDLLPGAGVSRVKPIVESLMQQYHDDRSVVPVLVLPDEPEGLTTDSTNPEPGRGTK